MSLNGWETVYREKMERFRIIHARNTGGKAGKGRNKTSTLQLIKRFSPFSYAVIKQFRYTVGNAESLKKANEKAEKALNDIRGESTAEVGTLKI